MHRLTLKTYFLRAFLDVYMFGRTCYNMLKSEKKILSQQIFHLALEKFKMVF